MLAIDKIWAAIEALLTADVKLRSAATKHAIATLERVIGKPLPAELGASLAIHDGTRDDAPLWSNERLLGAAAIARRMRMMRGLLDHEVFSHDHWSPSWIPLTDADGNGFCLAGRRVIYFRNHGGGGKVVANSYRAWLASLPRRIRAEGRRDRRLERIVDVDPALPKRVRDRLARIDRELPFLVAFVEDWPHHSTRRATRERILTFRSIARLPAAEVLARAIERGFVVERRGTIAATAAGRRLRP